jgi:hypothetical protein
VSLLIPFDPSGLDAKVVSALDDIIAAVQTWSASPFGLARKRMSVMAATQTITTSADPFSVTWQQAPSGSDTLYDTGGFLDSGGVFINFTQVGTYLVNAELWFAGNAAGFRYAGIFGTNDLDPRAQVQVPAMANNQTIEVMHVFRVSSPPVKYRIGVFQNTGGGLSLLGPSYLQVTQLE